MPKKKAEKCPVCGKKGTVELAVADGPDTFAYLHPCEEHRDTDPAILLALSTRSA